jgi:hypothetical protein
MSIDVDKLMKDIDDRTGDDPEMWHCLADDAIASVLRELGYNTMADWFDEHEKWYS